MADAGDLKSPAYNGRAGSSPASAIYQIFRDWRLPGKLGLERFRSLSLWMGFREWRLFGYVARMFSVSRFFYSLSTRAVEKSV